jgi:hypothetical protein
MFDQYTEIQKILTNVTEIKMILRTSGISEMEEMLQEKLRTLLLPVIVTEDDGNGFFALDRGNFDSKYFTFYVFDMPKQADSTSRKEKLLVCRKAALKLLKEMKAKSLNFGDPFYGLDFSRIDYQQLGPIATGLHGYSFSYMFHDENFNLVDPIPEH